MAKAIFQGRDLSNSIKNEDGKISVGLNIDPFREWGFLTTAYTGTAITETSGGYFKDIASTNAILGLTENQKIYSINTGANTATKVHDTPGASATYKLCAYQTNISSSINPYTIFYFYGTTVGLYDGSTFTDNWMATTPAGASALGTFAIPYVWQNFMMVGYTTASSNYIAKFDGATGANGTLTPYWFNLGSNWSVVNFFSYSNYLGVLVSNPYSYEYQILLLDGSSGTLPVKRIVTSDTVYNVFNINDDVIFLTSTGIKQLGENGLQPVKDLNFENPTSIGALTSFAGRVSDKLDNAIYFGTSRVRSFKRKDANNPYIISDLYPFTGTATPPLMIRGAGGLLFVESYTGGNYYLQYFSSGNATGTLKFPFKDFGQRVILNNMEVFFKPLTSGQSITVGLDTNYGTSHTIQEGGGVISYTKFGAITSKKFDLNSQECFSFRPTVAWTSGGASISHITVDYSFIDN